jgi:hypothetical protein
MTVEILRLSGLPAAEAQQAADVLLDLDTGPDRLGRLLVLDDTALLDEHAPVYQHIDMAQRVERLLCVAMGPRAGGSRKLELPGNLGGTQGWPVLWVSRPGGINWRMAKAAVANRHPGAVPTAADQHPLVMLLSVDEMFDHVHERFLAEVPARVASPGLWLAGADDEAATFAGALVAAIRCVSEPGSGADGAFGELLPARAGGASLSDSGPLARYLGRVAEMDREAARALGKARGVAGLLKRGDADVQRYVIKAGEALGDLRELIVQVLRDASVPGSAGELTANQRELVRSAGLEFDTETAPPDPARGAESVAEHSLIYRTLARAVTGGDSIPQVAKRLTVTERQVTRQGSASYLPEVEERCPAALLARLADAPRRVPRSAAVAEARRELGLADVVTAAQALADLVLAVANREWSPVNVTPRELAEARTALDGSRKALADHAKAAGGIRGGARGARLARLGDRLLPVLRDLVLHVVAAELNAPSATGQEALRTAHGRATSLLAEWAGRVQADGVATQPPFPSSSAHDAQYASQDDVAEVRDALLYPGRDEMWQLCTPADLSALDVDTPPISVRFASRLNREALIGLVPGDEPVWTSTGSFAGLLRLVSLRAGVATSSWGHPAVGDRSSGMEP